jgi:2,4-dienoyl-CoA reductase-like NADH-dependent reductase (Old Yellow Enzyme family)
MEVPNRIVMAPMERNYANPDGTVSDRTLAHYAARANGGVGWIDVESTFVDQVGRGRTHQLGLHDDRCIEGFRALADLVHGAGTKIGIELHHAGRNTNSAISGAQPVAPSPVACPEAGGEVPRELTIGEIDAILERYALAAARAADAGFDAVELHSAHGYLPLAFLSPLTNRRTDDYGGSLQNRMRFALRAIAAIREAVGHRLAVGTRFSAREHLKGGLDLTDTISYAQALERAGVDYLSVSTGVYASFVNIIPPMDFAPGWLLETAAQIKKAVALPVIGASRIVDVRLADRAIAEGQVDLVALGRALLTDPDLPRKARDGSVEDIVCCIGCNQGCENRISAQRDVTCLVNPEVGREAHFGIAPASARKRVVVIGGGPAGMEAARVCAERGHDVTLYEGSPRLGGMLGLAAELPRRTGWVTFLEQSERRLRASGADVRLGEQVREEDIATYAADTLVLATGARFDPPTDLTASDGTRLLDPTNVLGNRRQGGFEPQPDTHVVVVGAGAPGLGLASWLASRQIQVTVVADESEIADPPGEGGLLDRLAATGRVVLRPDRQIAGLATDVTISRSGAIGPLFSETLSGIAAVVWTSTRRSRTDLAGHARRHSLVGELIEVGDCRLPRSALEAIYEGAAAGRSI